PWRAAGRRRGPPPGTRSSRIGLAEPRHPPGAVGQADQLEARVAVQGAASLGADVETVHGAARVALALHRAALVVDAHLAQIAQRSAAPAVVAELQILAH